MPGLVLPVGVGVVRAVGVAPGHASPSLPSAYEATADLSATTTMFGASARRSSAKRFATQPVAMTRGAWGMRAARRRALRVFASASPVTAQVFTMMTSACVWGTRASPASSSERAIRSLSTRLTRHPRFTKAKVAELMSAYSSVWPSCSDDAASYRCPSPRHGSWRGCGRRRCARCPRGPRPRCRSGSRSG